jgi:hypothetical protein
VNVLAHGGTPGLIVEASMGILAACMLAAIWVRERRRRGRKEHEGDAPMRD